MVVGVCCWGGVSYVFIGFCFKKGVDCGLKYFESRGFVCRLIGCGGGRMNATSLTYTIFVTVRLDVANVLAVIAGGCFYPLVER